MEGSNSENDGKIMTSVFFTLDYNYEKSRCQPYWDIIDNPSSLPEDVTVAKQKLLSIENENGYFHCVDKARFFYHKENGKKHGLLTGICNLSDKPNTSNSNDTIGIGDFYKICMV
jgi:hypothetical protein